MDQRKNEKTHTDIIKEFQSFLRSRSIRSIELYSATIESFLSWCEPNHILYLCFTEENAIFWRHQEVQSGRRHGTINNKIVRLRLFYDHLRKSGRVLVNPFDEVRFLKSSGNLPKSILNLKDIERLLDGFPVRTHDDGYLKTLLEILYGSALRISEAATLKEEDVDSIRGALHIIEHKNGGERRWIPATEASLKAIETYKRIYRNSLLSPTEIAAGYLFPQEPVLNLRHRFNRRLAATCRRLGLKVMTSHSLRHSAATHLLCAGAGIRQVQEFLGHRRISTTERYTHLIKDDLKALIDNLHPRSGAKL